MPNTAGNDAPYVIGAIEDPGSANYENLQASHDGGFDRSTINPFVINADGSFVAAFQVSAPVYLQDFLSVL